MALEILDRTFQPTKVQDVATMAHIPVVGDMRIDVTDNTVLSLSMDETSSGAAIIPLPSVHACELGSWQAFCRAAADKAMLLVLPGGAAACFNSTNRS